MGKCEACCKDNTIVSEHAQLGHCKKWLTMIERYVCIPCFDAGILQCFGTLYSVLKHCSRRHMHLKDFLDYYLRKVECEKCRHLYGCEHIHFDLDGNIWYPEGSSLAEVPFTHLDHIYVKKIVCCNTIWQSREDHSRHFHDAHLSMPQL